MALLTSDDLLSPKGPVTPTLFPEEPINVIRVRLEGYLTEGYAKDLVVAQTDESRKNKAARAWALHRAFDDVAIRMAAEPLDVNNGTEAGSHGYSVEQITKMEERAADYLEEFDGLAVVTGAAKPPQFARNVFTW